MSKAALVYSRDDLIKAWKAYEAPSVSDPAVKAIITDEVNLPEIVLPNLEPIVNVNSGGLPLNSSHGGSSGIRRRGGAAVSAGPRRSQQHDDAPVLKTDASQEAGEWHVVGDKKTHKEKDSRVKREPGSWRTRKEEGGLSLSFSDEHQGQFYEDDAGQDDKSRLSKLMQSRQSPEGSQSKKLQWFYVDPSGKRQGPFSSEQMFSWRQTGYLGDDLPLAYIYSDSTLPANPQYTPLGVLFPPANGKPFTVAPVGLAKPKPDQAWLWSQAEDTKK